MRSLRLAGATLMAALALTGCTSSMGSQAPVASAGRDAYTQSQAGSKTLEHPRMVKPAVPVAPVSAVAPASHVISGIPQYHQLPQSCEETALSMALVHQGLHISTGQLLAREGVDWTHAVVKNGRLVSGGDPDKAFVGSVNFPDSIPDGPTSYPKLLVRVLNGYGAHVLEWSEPGVTANTISAAEIYTQILMGHPVVAYATWDWVRHPIYHYTSEDGNSVATIYPALLHVYAVVGVNATSVLVHDPIRGTYWVSKHSFEAGYEFGMAIVLQ